MNTSGLSGIVVDDEELRCRTVHRIAQTSFLQPHQIPAATQSFATGQDLRRHSANRFRFLPVAGPIDIAADAR
jgi:hypothetical protein